MRLLYRRLAVVRYAKLQGLICTHRYSVILPTGLTCVICLMCKSFWSSNPGPTKSKTELETIRQHFTTSVFWRYVTEMGSINSLHALAVYSE